MCEHEGGREQRADQTEGRAGVGEIPSFNLPHFLRRFLEGHSISHISCFPVQKAATKAMEAGERGIGRVVGLAAKPILPDASVKYPDAESSRSEGHPTSTHLPAGQFDTSSASVPAHDPAPHRVGP